MYAPVTSTLRGPGPGVGWTRTPARTPVPSVPLLLSDVERRENQQNYSAPRINRDRERNVYTGRTMEREYEQDQLRNRQVAARKQEHENRLMLYANDRRAYNRAGGEATRAALDAQRENQTLAREQERRESAVLDGHARAHMVQQEQAVKSRLDARAAAAREAAAQNLRLMEEKREAQQRERQEERQMYGGGTSAFNDRFGRSLY